MRFTPYQYQTRTIDFIMSKPYCGLFLDMGLGKTVCTLTAIRRLMDNAEVRATLVIAPKKVAESTWSVECEKWDHLRDLQVSVIMGTSVQRTAAVKVKADIYVINRDNVNWLVDNFNDEFFMSKFDVMVIDELTSFKTPKSLRFKSIKKIRPLFDRVIGLTGTPAPNGLKDLWAQLWCLDMGQRLEKTQSRYRSLYFDEYRRGAMLLKCDIKNGMDKVIFSKIKDITISMKAEDYLTLPDMVENTVMIRMTEKSKKDYETFEKENVLKLKNENIIAINAAALLNKLSQYANGAIYGEDGKWTDIHQEKLEALDEIIEASQGQHILVFYQFIHDSERILKRYPLKRIRVYKDSHDMDDWNAGKIDILLAHPASTAYGLNMQQGGHTIVWFGTGWNLELYQQANARLHRQGQQHPVMVYRLVMEGTVDEDQTAAIVRKADGQQALMEAVKARFDKYCNTKN